MITTMPSDQNGPPPRVEVITSVQRRRRWPTAEKIRLVEETMQPGMSVSYVARRAGVAPTGGDQRVTAICADRTPCSLTQADDRERCGFAFDAAAAIIPMKRAPIEAIGDHVLRASKRSEPIQTAAH
jgi:Transposase